jgi:hypothetical protein
MPGHYGMGESIDDAVKRVKQIAGPKFISENGYKVFRAHPEKTVGGMGEFHWFPERGGYKPVEVLNRSKHK